MVFEGYVSAVVLGENTLAFLLVKLIRCNFHNISSLVLSFFKLAPCGLEHVGMINILFFISDATVPPEVSQVCDADFKLGERSHKMSGCYKTCSTVGGQ